MIHKLMGTWYDTILYFGILIVSLGMFLGHWKEEYQIRYAEIVLQEFLTDVTVDGKITTEEYEETVRNLARINPKFDVDISCLKYALQPMYAPVTEHSVNSYYAEENKKEEKRLSENDEERRIAMRDLIVQLDEAGELLLEMGDYVSVCLSDGKRILSLMQQKVKQNGRLR